MDSKALRARYNPYKAISLELDFRLFFDFIMNHFVYTRDYKSFWMGQDVEMGGSLLIILA